MDKNLTRNNGKKQRLREHRHLSVSPYTAGLLILLALFAVQILYVTRGGYLYGNDYDWTAQHVELPSYLRQLFYKTGKFFPDFAMNLGAGQNIYYIAYYGLFSPVVLVSYLLPFVPMLTYMTAASIVLTALSIVLIWRWLHTHLAGYAAFAAALMFTLAIPVMYHSHHHLMFVNYLPFMILAMEGMEKYIQKGKCLQLILSVFLMILSSFFFSVGGIVCLFLYWLYCYPVKEGIPSRKAKASPGKTGSSSGRNASPDMRLRIKVFCGNLLRLIGLLFIPVLMSAVLWLPLLHVILSGRSDTTISQSLKDLVLPRFQDASFFYQTGGMGLTAVFLLCVAACIVSSSRRKRFAGLIFLLLMFFGLPVYLLNGGMYVNGKALIPFLPFAALLFGEFLEATAKRRYSLRNFLIAAAVISAAAFLTWQDSRKILRLFTIDLISAAAVILLLYIRAWKTSPGSPAKKLRAILPGILLVPALILCFLVNGSDSLLKADENPRTVYGSDARKLLKTAEQLMEESGSLARTDLFYNPATTTNYVLDTRQLRSGIYSSLNNHRYHKYYYKEAGNEISGHSNAVIKPVKNPMNSLLLGVRYIIAPRTKTPVKGYRMTAASGSLALYENPDALPLGYLASGGDFRPEAVRLSPESVIRGLASIRGVRSEENRLSFHLKKENKITVPIDASGEKRILQITMRIDNSSYRTKRSAEESDIADKRTGEIRISVNGTRNVLSSPNWRYSNHNNLFHFTLMVEPGVNHLTFRVGKGRYTVSDISVTAWPYSQYTRWRSTVTPWKAQQKSDNVLIGSIHAKADGNMRITIPYDDGFQVTVDGKPGKCLETKDGFLSVPLKKGIHAVTLTFHAPMKRTGIALSASGVLLLILLLIYRKKRGSVAKKRRLFEAGFSERAGQKNAGAADCG